MDREVSTITRLGIGLIFLALAIGIGFGIFSITSKAISSDIEMVDTEENRRPEASLFDEFNNTFVTGNTVSDIIYKYSESDVAILVATIPWLDACEKADTESKDIEDVSIGIKGAYNNHGNTIPTAYVFNSEEAMNTWQNSINFNDPYLVKNSKGNNVPLRFVNYRYLLGSTYNTAEAVSARYFTYNGNDIYKSCLYFDENNCLIARSGFASDVSGRGIDNNTFVNVNKSDRTEFVSPEGKFHSYIIKDELGLILGVAFIQIPS